MAIQQATSEMTGKPLIESDRVEGTTVYDTAENNIGSIRRLMIEKISGRVCYAVFGAEECGSSHPRTRAARVLWYPPILGAMTHTRTGDRVRAPGCAWTSGSRGIASVG
jgi:hypothetical protein